MIDVCLIYLPKPYLRSPDAQNPLGLLYLAASLLENGKIVELKNYAHLSDETAIDDLPPANLYGITATSLEILHANRFAARIKQKYHDAKVVIGGPGTYAQEFIDPAVIDSICFGDGEYAILDMLEDAKNNQLKPVYYADPIHDLDALPMPARHLIKDHQGGDIFAYGKKYAEGQTTVITSSRGCYYKCAFCSAPSLTYNNSIRFRSPRKVAEEIRHVKEKYGIRQFRFSDDMFSATEKRTLELCDAIGPENVHWRISCRVKPFNDTMAKSLKDAGCVELSFGIENFSNDVLRILRKNSTVKDNVNALELADRYGFSTRILMMVRTPGQTPKTIEENKYWLSRVPFSIIANTALLPLPGSELWINPLKYNIEILDRDLDKYNFYMFNDLGRRKIDPIFNIIGRDINEFHSESESFRDFLEELGKLNKG